MNIKTICCFILGYAIYLVSPGCENNQEAANSGYTDIPVLDTTFVLMEQGQLLRPVRLQLFNDTLFVTYRDKARIDLYTPDFKLLKTIPLDQPHPAFPVSLAVTDSMLIISDHSQHAIVLYDRQGKFIESYGSLPDSKTPLAPLALDYYGGVLYVSDMSSRKVLAISMADAAGITERGELILIMPHDTTDMVGFPSAIRITYDGRLLIGDAGKGQVLAFTCDGRFIYLFDSVDNNRLMAPTGFDSDNIIDPSVQDSSSFDPSGIRKMGRIHMTDANNAKIHMFSPLGRYLASYPVDSTLQKPSDIAIDRKRKKIYVADPIGGRVLRYGYGE